MNLTYEKCRVDFIKDGLGLDTDEDGYVLYEDGEYAAVSDGKEKLHKDEVGAFEHNEDYPQDTLLVPDTFPEIVEHSKRMQEKDTDEEAAEEAMEEWLHSVAESTAQHEKKSQRGYLVVVAVAVLVLAVVVRRLLRKLQVLPHPIN